MGSRITNITFADCRGRGGRGKGKVEGEEGEGGGEGGGGKGEGEGEEGGGERREGEEESLQTISNLYPAVKKYTASVFAAAVNGQSWVS